MNYLADLNNLAHLFFLQCLTYLTTPDTSFPHASRPQHVVYIDRTGAGKTTAIIVPALLDRSLITIVITPLVPLHQSLFSSLRQTRQKCPLLCDIFEWAPELHARPGLIVLATAEQAAFDPRFKSFVQQGKTMPGCHVRFVVDEPQVFYLHSRFRDSISQIPLILDGQDLPITFLSATLPPSFMNNFFTLFNKHPSSTVTFRNDSTARFNLAYHFTSVTTAQVEDPSETLFQHSQESLHPGTKLGILYFGYKNDGHQYAHQFTNYLQTQGILSKVEVFTGDLSHSERSAMIDRWTTGDSHPLLVSVVLPPLKRHFPFTFFFLRFPRRVWSPYPQPEACFFFLTMSNSLLSLQFATPGSIGQGVDIPNVRLTIHFNIRYGGLVSWIQETGRAGRDGDMANCLTYMPSSYASTAMAIEGDEKAYQNMITSEECRRVEIASFLDGKQVSSFHCLKVQHAALCDRCSETVEAHNPIRG